MKAGIVLVLILCIHNSFAQNVTSTSVAGRTTAPPPMFLRDVFTTPFESKAYAGIEGSPFLEDSWVLARLTVEGFKIIERVSIKLNLYANAIHFINEKGEELQMSLNVDEIRIIDSNSKYLNSVFLAGLEQDKLSFFEILEDGNKMKLLKKTRAFQWETKPLGSEVQRKFQLDEELYLFSNKILYKTNKNCSALALAFKGNDVVTQFISKNNIKCNKEADLKKLVAFFNSL